METRVVTAWEIKTFDRVLLDGRHYFVLSKSLVPVPWDWILHQPHGTGSQRALVENLPLERENHPNQLRGADMPYYCKKPIPVEAHQYTGDNFVELQDWSENAIIMDDYSNTFVVTLEGLMLFHKGDYVIKGVRGEFYPCQKDIFEETYKKADNGIDVFREKNHS